MAKKRLRRIEASVFMPSHRQCVPDRVRIFFFFFTLPFPEALQILMSNARRFYLSQWKLSTETKNRSPMRQLIAYH